MEDAEREYLAKKWMDEQNAIREKEEYDEAVEKTRRALLLKSLTDDEIIMEYIMRGLQR